MGCICWKGNRATKHLENNRHKKGKAHKDSTKTAKKFPVFSRKDNAVSQAASSSDEEEKKAALSVVERPKKTLSHSQSLSMEAGERSGHNQMRISRIMDVTGGEKGAQVVAGWPSWLAAVAGEAINGWIPRKAESFEKLEKVYKLVLPFLNSFIVLILVLIVLNGSEIYVFCYICLLEIYILHTS